MLSVVGPDPLPDAWSVGPTFTPRPPIPPGPFLIAGLGRAGRAAAHVLRQSVGPEQVRAWDADTGTSMRRLRTKLEAQGIRTCLGPRPSRRDVRWAGTVVKSPGLPFQASVIQRALAMDREVLDELELGWRLSRAPMLAVTGTNGKSTVSGLATSVLSAAGRRVQLAGNTEFGPSLSAVSSRSLDWIVCEVSSFQLEGCVQMLPELAVFTNLTSGHLGRHRTLERYGAVKRRLFVRDGVAVARAVIDVDDSFGRGLAAHIEQRGGVVARVGFSRGADYRVESATWDLRRAETRVGTPAGPISLTTALPGAYNARNVAAALAIADLIGVERRLSVPAICTYGGVPGRFERIDAGQPFDVIVDFAHTPDALEQLIGAIRAGMRPGGRLVVVFGIGGAPGTAMTAMGRIARESSDELILTTAGSNACPPLLTLKSILVGARSASGGELEVILDRHRAIEAALSTATANDVVVIPGRGAMPSMRADPRGEAVPFDDREVTRKLVRTASAAPDCPHTPSVS
jgi:UDP-N-acetylmuramoyl-L-alanyl-D-glutamate--2,6-diaminopimelate ligase